jgi:hypothetical protein
VPGTRVSGVQRPVKNKRRGRASGPRLFCGRAVSRVLSPRRRGAAISLGRALPRASSDLPGVQVRRATSPPVRSCSGWGLPCRKRRRFRGALLPHLFTLAAGLSPGSAVCFLWRCPGRSPRGPRRWALPTTLPCGARTFLDARPEGPRRGRTRPQRHFTPRRPDVHRRIAGDAGNRKACGVGRSVFGASGNVGRKESEPRAARFPPRRTRRDAKGKREQPQMDTDRHGTGCEVHARARRPLRGAGAKAPHRSSA